MKTYKIISPNTAKQYLGAAGVAALVADVQGFWDDVHSEEVEEDFWGDGIAERVIVERYALARRYGDPLLIAGEVYYWPVMDQDGNIFAMDENECDLLHIEFK